MGDLVEAQLFETVASLSFTLLDPFSQALERQAAGARSAPLCGVLFSLMPLYLDIAALLVNGIAQTFHKTTVAAQGADGHGRRTALAAARVVGKITADLFEALLVGIEQLEAFGKTS